MNDSNLIAAFLAKRPVTVIEPGARAMTNADMKRAIGYEPDVVRHRADDADLGYARWEAAVQAAHVGDRDLANDFASGSLDHTLGGR